jgi:hypothetical protein
LTELAARTNLGEILESYKYDLQAILLEDAHSPLCPGSEFCPTAILDPVLQGHPLWARDKKTLMHGAHLPVEPIEEEPRLQDLLEAIEFGNHESAKDGPKLLSIFGTEVEKGWQLTLPISALQHLPGAVIGPVGIVSQDSIDAFGHRLPKDRPIHDQSLSFGSGQPLNNRVIEDELTPCQYGFSAPSISLQDCGSALDLPCRANSALKIRVQVGLQSRPLQG